MDKSNERYLEFASSISFFEFNQKEFNEPHFNTQEYQFEINKIKEKTNWTIDELSLFLRENPKSYEIFQEIFQLKRFTNTQLTHFLFDIWMLNSIDTRIILEYLETNLKNDSEFRNIFINNSKEFFEKKFENIEDLYNYINGNNYDNNTCNQLIFLLKLSIQNYIGIASKSPMVIHNRIKNEAMPEVSTKIAAYIVDNLNFNEIKKGINLDQFLKSKRIPKDTKSIHGKYGGDKISRILTKNGFVKNYNLLNKTLDETSSKLSYCAETRIEDIVKKDGKLKKFDFILYYELKPIVLIETNFYSTSGSKININDDEYTFLDDEIKENYPNLKFIWITDGNYWLTSEGRQRFMKLYKRFENRILNYNLFEKEIFSIIKT